MRFSLLSGCVILTMLWMSCGNNSKVSSGHALAFDTIKYSKQFGIAHFSSYKQLYYIEGKDTTWSLTSADLPENNCKIAVTSSVFAGFIEELRCHNLIVAIDNINYFNDSLIIHRFNNGQIQAIGEEGQLRLETIMQLKPDVLICSSITGKDKSITSRLAKSGIKVLYCDNFKEQHPLARAEWIKFFGFVCNQSDLANTIFNDISIHYNNLKNENASIVNKPSVLTDALYQGVWNIPGANSYTARLIEDAGGKYIFDQKTELYTYPLNLESVVKQASNADFWIHVNQYKTIGEMLKTEARYKFFKPILDRKVFNYNKRENQSGGNDFWEKGVVRADWVLKDLSIIFQNDKNNYGNLYFYTWLN